MTIKSIRTGWTGISANAGNPIIGNFESIKTVTVGSGGSSTITFSDIPQSYQHLQIRCIARDNQGSGINNDIMRFNSDSGSNYSHHYIYGTGSGTPVSSGGTNNNSIPVAIYVTSAGSGTGRFAATVIDILDYSNTNKYTTTRSFIGGDDNGSGIVLLTSGGWRNTAAVNTITFPSSGTFQQYSHFALYGIR
jgi:hypothetical protein